MSSYFVLGLDTHAPVITWGAIEGADAGETLIVHYTIDEPAVISATVMLPDGTVLPMMVAPDQLSADIPGGTRTGTATVAAVVEDDVANNATRTLDLALGGVIPPVQVGQPTTGLPSGQQFEPRVIRGVSQAGASSRDRVRAHVSSASSAQARSHYSGPTHRVVRTRDVAATASRTTVHGSWSDQGSAVARAQPDSIRRREGPDHQAELILLDIL